MRVGSPRCHNSNAVTKEIELPPTRAFACWTALAFGSSTLMAQQIRPAGSPNFLVGLADSTHLNFFRFHVDFNNPANSTFSGPTLIPVAPFNEIYARANTV